MHLHGHRKGFAVGKHGGLEAARQAAEDELQKWRNMLQEKLKDSICMRICIQKGKSEYECGCSESLAKRCIDYCIIQPGSFEHKLLEDSSADSIVADLVSVVSSIFAKRTARKVSVSPGKLQASTPSGTSPEAKKDPKRHKAQNPNLL